MGIINQPKPSEPGSIVPEQRPLEPGQTTSASAHQASPQRKNLQTPETQKQFGENDEPTRRDD